MICGHRLSLILADKSHAPPHSSLSLHFTPRDRSFALFIVARDAPGLLGPFDLSLSFRKRTDNNQNQEFIVNALSLPGDHQISRI